MKILLLNPPHLSGTIYMKELGRCGRKSIAGELWPQTGLAYLAAVLLQSGHDCKILDAMAEGITIIELQHQINRFAPELIVIHTTTPTFNNDAAVIEFISKSQPQDSKLKLGFTGTHVTVLPYESLAASVADFILIGEAEYTLLELANEFNADWSKISGLAFRDKSGQIQINSRRPLISDLDTIPFPARHLLPNQKYRMPFFDGEPFVTIIPSRGCPYQCTFCRAGAVWGEKIRLRSVQNVCDEIELVINQYNIRNIVFMTDALTLKKSWTVELCNMIQMRKLNFRWIGNSRVDTVDFEMLKLMHAAGCELISYGIESGNQEILDRAKKRITLAQAEQAIRWTKEAGILAFAYFIIGLPGETWETIDQSISFAKKLDPDYVNFHIATPFPGTELYQIAKDNHWLITDDWSQFEEEGSAVMRTEHLTASDLIQAQKKAMRQFYFRPRQFGREIMRIRNVKDLKKKIHAGLKVFSDF
ncbi:MAG: B12-binding domain-containing radical SAM protein [bacterium]|nr:B12-binding domain-containing radical SAM protein [bacterium]